MHGLDRKPDMNPGHTRNAGADKTLYGPDPHTPTSMKPREAWAALRSGVCRC